MNGCNMDASLSQCSKFYIYFYLNNPGTEGMWSLYGTCDRKQNPQVREHD